MTGDHLLRIGTDLLGAIASVDNAGALAQGNGMVFTDTDSGAVTLFGAPVGVRPRYPTKIRLIWALGSFLSTATR